LTKGDERELSRTSLKIYVLLLESGKPLGVRDIARALDIPASTVHYHIRKLEELGVVRSSGLGYEVANPLKLEEYIILGRRLVPRLLIYSLFFLGVAIGEAAVVAARGYISYDAVVALVTSLVAFTLLIYEGYKFRRKLWH